MYNSRSFCSGKLPLVEHPHDVRMIELGQRLRLGPAIARDLQRHHPLHRTLPGEKHGGERPFAQRREQIEVVDPLTGLEDRHPAAAGDQRGGLLVAVDRDQPLQLGGSGRKPLAILDHRHRRRPPRGECDTPRK